MTADPSHTSAAPSPTCRRCGQPDPGQQCRCGLFQPGNQLGRRFEPGHTLSTVHGAARGGALLEATARDCLAELDAILGDQPGSEKRYMLARWSAALALARTRLVLEHLDRVGWIDGKGRPRTAYIKLLETAHAALIQHLDRLGMTPAAAGKLGLDLTRAQATSLAAEIAAARRSRGGKS